MVVGDIAGESLKILSQLGYVALWLQALGVILIIWLVAESFGFYYNRKRMQEVYKIKEDMKRIEGKIDKLISRK